MSWFNPARHLSRKAKRVLEGMTAASSSETNAVVDCLNTIAENGAEYATDESLVGNAEEILGAAREFIEGMGGDVPDAQRELYEALEGAVRGLDDASGVVDAGEGEEYAYQRELEHARQVLEKYRTTAQTGAQDLATTQSPDYWGEDEQFPVSIWQVQVRKGETRDGYWEWVKYERGRDQEEVSRG